MFSSLGSLSAGKLADYIIYPAGVDLLNDDISSTKDLKYVARGGRLWDASSMEEVWPVKGRKQEMPPFNADWLIVRFTPTLVISIGLIEVFYFIDCAIDLEYSCSAMTEGFYWLMILAGWSRDLVNLNDR